MELETRAYAAFEVKALDAAGRKFSGWATTPAVDRVGDTVNPLGARFKNPLPLLHQHRHDSPIGIALFGKPTKQGIEFDAEIPEIEEPGLLKDRVDMAWGEIRHGLVRFVSIGFRALKYAFRDDGVDYQEIEVFELSAVTIPALPDAVISSVKAMRPLSAETIRELKRYDAVARGSGIPLTYRIADRPDTGGAVRLIR